MIAIEIQTLKIFVESINFLVNLPIFLYAVAVHWPSHTFDPYLLLLGTLGSLVKTIGLAFSNIATARGPMGPVGAITACSALLLVIVEAVRNQTAPSVLELVGLFIGLIGAIVLTIPSRF